MNIFDDLLGNLGKKPGAKSEPDLRIAFEIWKSKQPFFQKIPAEDDAVIKIKAGDFRKIAAQSYAAGYERSKL